MTRDGAPSAPRRGRPTGGPAPVDTVTAMYSAAIGALVRQFFGQLNRGRVRLLMPFFASDSTFDFPGDRSWSGRYCGRTEIRAWLECYSRAGLAFEVRDVLVAGPPWNLRIAIRFRDRKVENGTTAYENQGVLYERVRWGRIQHHESHEDKIRVSRFDERAELGPRPGRALRNHRDDPGARSTGPTEPRHR